MSGAISLTGGLEGSGFSDQAVIYVALVSASYPVHGFATQSFYDTTCAPHQVSSTGTLANWHFKTGSLDGNNITFSSVTENKTIANVVLFKSGTRGTADYLLAQFDTGSAGGLSIKSNGGDITINWNGSGIFSL